MNNARFGPRFYLHFDASEPPVVRRVRRRISHQILTAQFGFYLTKIVEQIIGPAREVSSSTGLIAKASQYVLSHAFESESVADAYGVNDDACAPRAIYCFVEFSAACVIDSIRKQNDRSPCDLIVSRGPTNFVVRQHFVGSDVDCIVQRGGLMP